MVSVGERLRVRGVALEGRNGSIWQMYTVYRWSQVRIAEHFGISQAQVSGILKAVRDSIHEADKDDLLQRSLEFLAEAHSRAMEVADATPAPVVRGKDGDILYEPCPTHGAVDADCCERAGCEREVVRDYSARLAALRLALNLDTEVAKRMGLSAPEKHEVNAKVNYRIVGLDPDALT